MRDFESFPLFNHVEGLHFQEYQPVCSHNETDKTMTQVNTFASASNVAHVHKYTHSIYKYSGTRYSNQICLKTKTSAISQCQYCRYGSIVICYESVKAIFIKNWIFCSSGSQCTVHTIQILCIVGMFSEVGRWLNICILK